MQNTHKLNRESSLRLTTIVLFGMRLFRRFFRFTQDFGGGFIREAQILFDGGTLFDLEEDHGRGNAHTTEEQTPAGGELDHEGGFLGVHAGRVLEKDGFSGTISALTATSLRHRRTEYPCRNRQSWLVCGRCWRENPCTCIDNVSKSQRISIEDGLPTSRCKSGKQHHRNHRTCTRT